MKKIFIFFSVFFLFFSSCSKKQKESFKVLVTFVEGEVLLIRDNSSEKVKPNGYLLPKDIVKTSQKSTVDLKFPDESLLRIKENSQLIIKEISTGEKPNSFITKLEVSSGAILSRVKKLAEGSQVQLNSFTAVAAIRGTDFMMEVKSEDLTQVSVSSGEVAVSSATIEANPVLVGYHQKTLIYKDQPPRPAEEVLEEELKKLEEIDFIHAVVAIEVAKTVADFAEARGIKQVLMNYQIEHGNFPSSLQEFVNEGTIQKIPKDQWGTELKYTVLSDGNDYSLISAGPDKQFNTTDDIKY